MRYACSLTTILIAATTAFAVEWDAPSDLVSQARMSLAQATAPAAPPQTVPDAPVATDLTPGRFTTYVLALSWEPAFCTTPGGIGRPECRSQTASRYDANNLILHGLWPGIENDPKHTYNYCGVDAAVKALDKPGTWPQMPALPLSDGLRERLKIHMPGVGVSLENHEWYTHGSCSGLSPEDYFDIADSLVSTFAQTRAGRYISAHVGRTMDSGELLGEFEKDFGAGSAQAVKLYCLKDTAQLIEILVSMRNSPDIRRGFQGVLSGAGAKGTCPQNIELLAPAAH